MEQKELDSFISRYIATWHESDPERRRFVLAKDGRIKSYYQFSERTVKQ